MDKQIQEFIQWDTTTHQFKKNVTCNNMDKAQKNHPKWNYPNAQKY